MTNFNVSCPNNCGSFSGYLSREIPLEFNCPICDTPMHGYRILEEESNLTNAELIENWRNSKTCKQIIKMLKPYMKGNKND